jgi:hypothetical protein
LITGKNPLDITYRVFLKSGTEIETDLLDMTHDITVEVAVWLPLVFKADGNVSISGVQRQGAEIKLDQLSEIGGFITSLTDSGYIESLKLDVVLDSNPFKEGMLVIRSEGILIKNPMTENTLNITLNDADVKKINESSSFNPVFSIFMPNNEMVQIPKDLNILSVSMDVGIKHTIDLPGGGN